MHFASILDSRRIWYSPTTQPHPPDSMHYISLSISRILWPIFCRFYMHGVNQPTPARHPRGHVCKDTWNDLIGLNPYESIYMLYFICYQPVIYGELELMHLCCRITWCWLMYVLGPAKSERFYHIMARLVVFYNIMQLQNPSRDLIEPDYC